MTVTPACPQSQGGGALEGGLHPKLSPMEAPNAQALYSKSLYGIIFKQTTAGQLRGC